MSSSSQQLKFFLLLINAFFPSLLQVLGTHSGLVCILDFSGNEINRFADHSSRVGQISVDPTCQYFGSCSDEGHVIIRGLSSNHVIEQSFNRPITCIQLDPDYAKNKKERFICGGKAGRLLYSEKGLKFYF